MTFGSYYNVNNSVQPYNTNFKAESSGLLSAPIETVQKTIESGVDSFTKKVEEKKKKKSTKRAIAVGSTVLVVSSLVMLLNPRYSPKAIQQMKTWENQAQKRFINSKNSYLKSKFHQATVKIFGGMQKAFTLVSNGNSLKDIGFKYLCCDKNKNITFPGHKKTEKVLKTIDKGFTAIFDKPHKAITKWFDKISKLTVKIRYKIASSKIDKLNKVIEDNISKLPADKQALVRQKLQEATASRKYFNESKIYQRMEDQVNHMTNLERDIKRQWRSYKNGYFNKWVTKTDHFTKNLTFWAEDIMQPSKDIIVKQGDEAVSKLFGSNGAKGSYDEIMEIFQKHLNTTEQKGLQSKIDKVAKSLRSANHGECFEYFDKKRDLVLGSAPTDIVTAIVTMGAAGIAVGKADTKDERLSRLVTLGIPAVIGLGVSLACTAALLSGPVGILTGLAATLVTNKLFSAIDKHVLGHEDEDVEDIVTLQNQKKTKEVVNA